MNQRLSIKYNLFQKILFAVFIWFALSLPSPVGLFYYILIKSDYDFLTIAQRVVHFGICLAVSIYYYRETIIVEYSKTDLVVIDKKDYQTYTIPFKNLISMTSYPSFVRSTGKTYTYKISFLNEESLEDQLKFTAYYGKRIKDFREAVKIENPGFYRD